jgi:hypothetical protein
MSDKTKSESQDKYKPCWKGYARVPGKKAGTKGSCKKKGA